MLEYYSGSKGKVKGEGLIYIKITKLPRYLVLIFKRFHNNDYTMEKDSSHVIYSGNFEIGEQKYQLIGQICHEGTYEQGNYKSYVLMGDKWFSAEDLFVT
jgi:ubiquitin C-terminal hydrolase